MTIVTVVVPARNEENSIEDALRAVLQQDHPQQLMEVVVVDGCSDDDTADRAKRILDGSQLRRWTVLSNPERRTPSNLNRGLLWAEGDLIVRVDARSIIPRDYVRRLSQVMHDPNIAVAGGRQVAVARRSSLAARSIARALNNTHANGGSRYRNPKAASGPCDTAYLGVFRRDQLNEIGGWSDEFASNQDFEICRRMRSHGSIWYEADLPVRYEPRATYALLLAQYRRFGRWKAIYWGQTGDRPRPRQVVLLAGPGGLALAVAGLAIVRPRSLVAAATAGLVALLTIDEVGANSKASVAERLGSISAMTVIGAGWWSGALQEFIGGSSRRRSGTRGR